MVAAMKQDLAGKVALVTGTVLVLAGDSHAR